MSTFSGGFTWAEPELRAPLAHEKATPRAAAERNVLVAPDGTPVADASPDDLALRPSVALLACVQHGRRAGAQVVAKADAKRRGW
jgi:hypothetical protein